MSALAVLAALLLGLASSLAAWLATSEKGRSRLRSEMARIRATARLHLESRDRSNRWAELRARLAGVVGRLRGAGRRARDGRLRARDQARCLDELPELIDVVALGMSAGISFDAALDIYCSKYRTLLSELLGDAMRSWRLGLSTRRVALRELASQLEVPAFSAFVDTATESLAFGAPLAKTLADQAQSVRDERRMVLEERIEKAPVKMLVPTGTLVLPAMLLAILGPFLASLASLTG